MASGLQRQMLRVMGLSESGHPDCRCCQSGAIETAPCHSECGYCLMEHPEQYMGPKR